MSDLGASVAHMWIDCSRCPNLDAGCDGCVVAVLTGPEHPEHRDDPPRAVRRLEDVAQRRAIEALMAGGLVSPETVVEVQAG